MFQEINERLALLKSKQRQKANWEERVKTVTDELKRKRHERDQWAKQLEEEQKDVDRLKGVSLGALFYTLLGKREEKLTQEDAEVLQAQLNYEEAADTVADLQAELAELNSQLAELRFIEGDMALIMQEKRKLIEAANPVLAAELDDLTDSEAEAKANLKELQEAVSAGRAVESALSHAEDRLGSAKNWGTFDMFGGGQISTAIKHSRIDEARSAIHSAQSNLRRFESELKDVQRDVNIQIEIGGLLTFADYFFDGFITDWMVQDRIQNSLNQVSEKRTQIAHIVNELEAECRKAEEKVQEQRRKISAIIENA